MKGGWADPELRRQGYRSTGQVAKALGVGPRNVSGLAKKHGLGELIDGRYYFRELDVALMRSLKGRRKQK